MGKAGGACGLMRGQDSADFSAFRRCDGGLWVMGRGGFSGFDFLGMGGALRVRLA